MKNLNTKPNTQDSLWTLLTTVFAAFMAFPVSILSASILGTGGIGSLRIIQTIIDYSSRSDFGLTRAYAREIPILAGTNDNARSSHLTNVTFSSSITITILLIICLIFAYLLDINFNGTVNSVEILSLLLILILVDRLNIFLGKSLPAHGYFVIQSKSRMYRAIFYPLVGIPLIIFFELSGAISAIILSRFFECIYIWIKAEYKIKWAWDLKETIGLQKIGVRLWAINITNVVVHSVEIILLSSFLGLKATGMYAFALGAIKLFESFAHSQSNLFFRKYAIESGETDFSMEPFKQAISKDVPIFMYISIIFCFSGAVVYAFSVLVFLSEFQPSLDIMIILLPGFVLHSTKVIPGHILNLFKMFNIMLIIPLVLLLIQIFLSVFMINNFGVIGAAVSFTIILSLSGLFFTLYASKTVFANDLKNIFLIFFKQALVTIMSFVLIFQITQFSQITPLEFFVFKDAVFIALELLQTLFLGYLAITFCFTLIYGLNFLLVLKDLFVNTLTLGLKKVFS
tara:strand:- start:940 stop:2478 length:1539 start_codon:yes stop_codon:yes gene_type:complete